MQIFYNSAIQLSIGAFIYRQPFVSVTQCVKKFPVRFLDNIDRIWLYEVQAVSEFDDCPNDKWYFYFAAKFLQLLSAFLGICQCPLRILFPEINTRSEPIPGIVARSEFI